MDLVLKKNPCCETKSKTFKASIFWQVSGRHAEWMFWNGDHCRDDGEVSEEGCQLIAEWRPGLLYIKIESEGALGRPTVASKVCNVKTFSEKIEGAE